jgi:transcriptional regulator with XRE-family HTH domain
MTEDTKNIKAYLKAHIKNQVGINQKVVAGRIGKSPSFLSQVLSGDREGSLELLSSIAEVSGTSLAEGFEYITQNPTASKKPNIIQMPRRRKTDHPPHPDPEHVKIVGKFKNKKWARRINRLLLEIEEDPTLRTHVEGAVGALAEQARKKTKKKNDDD